MNERKCAECGAMMNKIVPFYEVTFPASSSGKSFIPASHTQYDFEDLNGNKYNLYICKNCGSVKGMKRDDT